MNDLLTNYQNILFNTTLIFSSVFEIVLACILTNSFYRPRFKGVRFDFFSYVALATLLIIFKQRGINNIIYNLTEFAMLIAILFLLYRGRIKSKIIGSAVFAVMVGISKSLSAFVFSVAQTRFLSDIDPDSFFLELLKAALTNSIMILLAVVIGIFAGRYTSGSTSFKLWLALFTVPVMTMITFSVFQYTLESYKQTPRITLYIYLSCAGLIITNILVFVLFASLRKHSAVQQTTAVLTAQLALQEDSVVRLETLYNRTRTFRHDIKNHILLMNMLAEQQNYDELKRYLQDLSGVIEESDYVRISGISAVDAILNEKLYEAQTHSITTEYDVIDLDKNNILPLDLCIILSNALDNAIQANMQINDNAARHIKLKAHGNPGFCLISVTNPYATPLIHSENGNLLTSKNDTNTHGFGLKSIESTVKKYNGEMLTKGEDNIFTLVIRLNEAH